MTPRRLQFGFKKNERLLTKRDFTHLTERGMSLSRGPLRIVAAPNTLDHHRLGLAVPRQVAGAVRRNRIRRRLREAFRHMGQATTPGYDVMIIVRSDTTLAPDELRALITEAVERLDNRWTKRRRK